MTRGLTFSLAILVTMAVFQASAQSTGFTPDGVQHFLTDFITEIAKEMKQQDQPINHLAASRRLLTQKILGKGTFQKFMGGLMGGNWTEFVPSSWSTPDFTWDNLGTFEYGSNMQDFLDKAKMDNITLPQSIGDIHKAMDEVSSHFCTPEKYIPSQKVFATCVGPAVSLAYVPKVCVLDKATHEVVCDPAKLVLTKSPGGCTHKYHSASTWTGKECKISGEVGFTKSKVQGGAAYQIPLKTIDIGYEP